MKPPRFDYHRALELDDALELKARFGGDASVLAGGQSLVPMLNFRLARPAAVVDIGGLDRLRQVEVEAKALRVGAMARQRTVEHAIHGQRGHALVLESLRHVAHPVIRNRGTVVGSLAHADPAAELPATLLALDGRLRAVTATSERWIEAADLFVFHLTTSLREDEVAVEAEFPAFDDLSAGAVVEVSRRHGDFALAGVCALVTADSDGRTISAARLAYFGVGPTPVRCVAAERLLAGERPSERAFEEAGRLASGLVRTADVDQATPAYRRELTSVVTVRALRQTLGHLTAAGRLR